MKRFTTFLFFASLVVFVHDSEAYAFEITLDPLDPPRLIKLPAGFDISDIHVSATDVDSFGSAPMKLTRTLRLGTFPITVARELPEKPFFTRFVRHSGQNTLVLGAEQFFQGGQVASVTVQITARHQNGGLLPPVPPGWTEAHNEPPRNLAIVTTQTIVQESRQLEEYIAHRQSMGFTVVVGVEDDWDQSSGTFPDERPERIRAWLRDVDEELELGYVLLIGSPTGSGDLSVPMKMSHPLGPIVRHYPPKLQGLIDPVPTDFYYADLYGEWDSDDDGQFGEYPDDSGNGTIDWNTPITVGRLPIYHANMVFLDELLSYIIDYELYPEPNARHRLILAAAFLGFQGSPTPSGGEYSENMDGADAAEQIREAILGLRDVDVIRLYEDEGVVTSAYEHEGPVDTYELLDQWQEGAGVVALFGHGSAEGIYRTIWTEDWNEDGLAGYDEVWGEAFLTSFDKSSLYSAHPAFTFHASCQNGWPEESLNLGAALLGEGAIGTVTASRVAVGSGAGFRPDPLLGDADTLAYIFTYLMYEGLSAGQAVAYLRYGLPADGWGYDMGIPMNGHGWLGKFEFNLYGDPTLGMGFCDGPNDCMSETACRFPGECREGVCFPGDEVVDCSDIGDQCNIGRCDPRWGECEFVPRANGTTCDDGLYCTTGDQCVSGRCVGEPRTCPSASGEAYCNEGQQRCIDPWEPPQDAGPDGMPPIGEPTDTHALEAGCACTTAGQNSSILSVISDLLSI